MPSQLLYVDTIDELRGLSGLGSIFVAGYHAAGDGGGGLFYWDAASLDPDNGGTILLPNNAVGPGRWKRNMDGSEIAVKWFGAEGNGTTDDTTAIRNAVTFAAASGQNSSVIFGKGIFIYSETIWIPWNPDYRAKDQNDQNVYLNYKGWALGNNGVSLIGSRDAAAQQGSARPATVLRWQGVVDDSINKQLEELQDQRPFKYSTTFVIASGFISFRDMAVENNGVADYFAAALPPWQYQNNGQVMSNPTGAERLKFYGVSCYSGANGVTNPKTGAHQTAPFRKGFLWCPAVDYSRMERCEFAAAAPIIIDMDGTDSFRGSGATTFQFLDNVFDSYFDTDVFRFTNCPIEILNIARNTFNAQAGGGLTVVNAMEIGRGGAIYVSDNDIAGIPIGNLIFRENEYDDNVGGESRMLKLKNTLNLDLANNNIQGTSNTAMIDLTDSVAHVGKNWAWSATRFIQSKASQTVNFTGAVDSTGVKDPNSYDGINSLAALQLTGPKGMASVRMTKPGDDTASNIDNAASAIATARAVNDSTTATGVAARVSPACYLFGGTFTDDVNVGVQNQFLTINGQSVQVNLVSVAVSPTDRMLERMEQFVRAINGNPS